MKIVLKTKIMEIDYLELAKQQFYDLKKEVLEDSNTQSARFCGAENTKEYKVNSIKFTIEICGYWEKSNWFDWFVKNDKGEQIDVGNCLLHK